MEKLIDVLRFAVVIVFFSIYVLPVHAIPCIQRIPGQGLEGSSACLDGAPADDTLGEGGDKAFDLNAGNYFGFNDWNFLQLKGPSKDETVVDVGLNLVFTIPVMGSWSILESTWEDFDNIVVILKSNTTGEDMIYWSSYLLDNGAFAGDWLSLRPLSSFSVFGRVSVAVPEASTWSMVAVGLVAMGWVGNLRRKRMFPTL